MRNIVQVHQKPWGRELWYAIGPTYLGKIIVIEKGHRLSLQFHRVKHETIYAFQGSFLLQIGHKRRKMREGSVAVIPPGTVHRFEARYGRAVLLEVSTPQAGDVVRLEDDYGRRATERRKQPRSSRTAGKRLLIDGNRLLGRPAPRKQRRSRQRARSQLRR
mgnify:FL=1